MKTPIAAALLSSFALTTAPCTPPGNTTPSSSPLGGPVNFGGQPSQNSSGPTSSASAQTLDPHKPLNLGGPINTAGAPDFNKSIPKDGGPAGVGGPINTGGKPDFNKSLPGDAGK